MRDENSQVSSSRALIWSTALLGTLAGLTTACDWSQYALLNSIPVEGDPRHNPVVHVFLAVDGLAYSTVEDAIEAQPGMRDQFSSAKLVSMFPATSDASWSRILHAAPMKSYEYEYFDPHKDEIVNGGYLGLIKHAIPPFEGAPLSPPAYYEAFNAWRNGYLSTYWNYQETQISFADTLDNVFFQLSGSGEFDSTYAAYIAEIDAMGHMQTRERARQSFIRLWRRIQDFKHKHPQRRFVFTIYSDHGMDFIPARPNQLVDFRDELAAVGLRPVENLYKPTSNWRDVVAINHTRVSYLALHTRPGAAPMVAALSSESRAIDLAMARIPPPPNADTVAGDRTLEWFELWRSGRSVAYFAYDSEHDEYILPAHLKTSAALDVTIPFPSDDSPWGIFSDEELFAMTADCDYPDLFYRVRTAFAPVGIEYPADVLLSFARPFASMGFKMPGGANEIASAGFHGGLDAGSSLGVLLTEASPLPATVRSDNVLDLFPQLATHMTGRGLTLHPGDANAALDYHSLP